MKLLQVIFVLNAVFMPMQQFFVPVQQLSPRVCGGTRCVCKNPLQPQFTRHADGSITSRCIFVWRPS